MDGGRGWMDGWMSDDLSICLDYEVTTNPIYLSSIYACISDCR